MMTRKKIAEVWTIAVVVMGVLGLTARSGNAGTIAVSTLANETDIVNTGGALVSAANFGAGEVLVVNGLTHAAGSAGGANFTDNFTFEGDYRDNASGLPDGTPVNELLEGIAGANGITMWVSGLSVGQEYLFQTYWEQNPGVTLTITMEGDSLSGVPDQEPAVLISYQFTAADDTLNILIDRNDNLGGDPNNWLSGYSLQEVGSTGGPVLTTTEPPDGAIDVVSTNDLVATFDKTVKAGAGKIALHKADDTLVEAIAVTDTTPPGTVTFNGSIVTIDFTNSLEGGVDYYVSIDSNAITDTAGNPFVGISDKTNWNFTTDGTAPTKVGMVPVTGATDVPVNADLIFSFDETVVRGTGSIVVRLDADDSEVQTIDVDDAAVTVTGTKVIVTLADLPPGTYYVEIESGAFTDPSGNPYAGISGSTAWRFATSTVAGLITVSILGDETNIVNTGGTLVSAANFGAGEQLIVNGLTHAAGSAGGTNFAASFAFEGDFRNNASGLPDGTPVNELLEGIAGANGLTMTILGLTIGQEYLFQTYWEQNPGVTLTITMEGNTVNSIADRQPAVLISYQFTARDDTLNIFIDRDDTLGGDPNNWLSGYSLQEVSGSAASFGTVISVR